MYVLYGTVCIFSLSWFGCVHFHFEAGFVLGFGHWRNLLGKLYLERPGHLFSDWIIKKGYGNDWLVKVMGGAL